MPVVTVLQGPRGADQKRKLVEGITEAFGAGRGICQDMAHLFIACARQLGIPARYVSGLLYRPGSEEASANANHAWAEAHIDGLGWIGFDPSLELCPMESHIRVAAALDYLGAAPMRGAYYGGDGEKLDVKFEISERSPRSQAQHQSQG